MKILSLLVALLLFASPAWALQAQLSWTDNSNNESGFKVYRSPDGTAPFVQIGSTAANVASFSDASAAAGNCYEVTAFNAAGESARSNRACVVAVPAAPGNVVVVIIVAP
jgi:uncharacterized protein YxeA